MKRTIPLGLAFALGLSSLAAAHEFTAGDLEILHPIALETPVAAKSGAGYLTVVNKGGTDDKLLSVRADFTKVMLHKSEEKDGIMSMSHVEAVTIPAGETVELSPGGYHVMFMGLNGKPLVAGDKIHAVLVFENAGEVAVDFNVEPRGDAEDHSAQTSSD